MTLDLDNGFGRAIGVYWAARGREPPGGKEGGVGALRVRRQQQWPLT